jgi:protein-disulfide isomerase
MAKVLPKEPTKADDSYTLTIPRVSALKKISFTHVLTALLIIETFFLGSLYTKVQTLEKNGGTQTLGAQTGTTDTGNQPAPSAAPQFVDVKVGKLPLLGNQDAPVTIVEFSDFQCPFCRSFYEDTYIQLKKDYIDTGKVKISYRHLPLDFHPSAQITAEAAECANEQGKFWEFHDLVYEKQAEQGTGTIQYTKDDLKTWVADLGVDTGAFSECVDSGKYTQAVKDDSSYAQSVGVSATPSFFVNGQKLEGAQPYNVFKTLIDQELEKS